MMPISQRDGALMTEQYTGSGNHGVVRGKHLERQLSCRYPDWMKNPFRYFKTSPEIIRLAVMMYIRFPLSLRQVEDLLNERGIDICHETVRAWWSRFGPMFAAEIRKQQIERRHYSLWNWHVDEVSVQINGQHFTFGERLIRRARFLDSLSLGGGIARLHCGF